jgi:hypothetical protein
MRCWSRYIITGSLGEVESVLFDYDDLLNDICAKHNGVIRNIAGDQYFLTFSDAENFFSAIYDLSKSWQRMIERYRLGLSLAAHRGDLNIIRSYLYSNDIHTTVFLERLNSLVHTNREEISIAVTGKVKDCAKGTLWENRFRDMDISQITDDRLLSIAREYGVFQFLF